MVWTLLLSSSVHPTRLEVTGQDVVPCPRMSLNPETLSNEEHETSHSRALRAGGALPPLLPWSEAVLGGCWGCWGWGHRTPWDGLYSPPPALPATPGEYIPGSRGLWRFIKSRYRADLLLFERAKKYTTPRRWLPGPVSWDRNPKLANDFYAPLGSVGLVISRYSSRNPAQAISLVFRRAVISLCFLLLCHHIGI